jgi:hypothetical protein
LVVAGCAISSYFFDDLVASGDDSNNGGPFTMMGSWAWLLSSNDFDDGSYDLRGGHRTGHGGFLSGYVLAWCLEARAAALDGSFDVC